MENNDQNQSASSEIVTGFLEAVKDLPNVTGEPAAVAIFGSHTADIVVRLEIDGRKVAIFVEVRKTAFPRDVRQIAWRLKASLSEPRHEEGKAEHLAVLASEMLSPGAKEMLRTERIGYYDLGGSLYLPGQSFYVLIDRPPPKNSDRVFVPIFNGARAHVLQALLNHSDDFVGIGEIAASAGTSASTTSNTMTTLDRLEWTEIQGAGPTKRRRLAKPQALLDAWEKVRGAAGSLELTARYFIPSVSNSSDKHELIQKIASIFEEQDILYAVTGEAAGQAYAPHLTTISKIHLRVTDPRKAGKALTLLDGLPVDEGWNVALVEQEGNDEALLSLRERIENVWYANPVQTWLDLLLMGGRAKELAQHLRATRLPQ